jgi:putative flippase GtrA
LITDRDSAKLRRQAIVGMICFCFNLVLMWYLVDAIGLSPLKATAISFFTLNSLGHHLARKIVFNHSRNEYKKSYARFMFAMAFSLSLNLMFMTIATKWLDMNYILASAMTAFILFLVNYSMHRSWTFS